MPPEPHSGQSPTHARADALSPDAALGWMRARGVRGLATDSRRVSPGDAFIAWPGYANDARQFVANALAGGAAACLVEAKGAEHFAFASDRVAAVAGLKAAAGLIASRYFGEPSAQLDVIAVTGTNGKTSTAWWTAQALAALGRRAGVVGTLGIGEPPQSIDAGFGSVVASGLTTPDPVTLQAAFHRFVQSGFAACAVEASSIGIVEERLAGTHIAVAQFTNFTQDHVDFHGSMAEYWAAKARLFAWPGLTAAVVNIDDPQGAALANELSGTVDLWTCSITEPARLTARDVQHDARGLRFDVVEADSVEPVRTTLAGDYNASNLLGVIGALRALGLPLADIAAACSRLAPVPGRMQRVLGVAGASGTADQAEAPAVIVDYAHTPDALEKALLALRPLAQQRDGRLWCVFGCGGNRDTAKRPLMGAIAERLADHVVLTSDNPRHEAPCFILSQILAGVVGHDEVAVFEDRAEAITHAVTQAAANDVVLIAGKGHEEDQEIAGVKRPFSDVTHAQAALRGRGGIH